MGWAENETIDFLKKKTAKNILRENDNSRYSLHHTSDNFRKKSVKETVTPVMTKELKKFKDLCKLLESPAYSLHNNVIWNFFL